MIFYKHIGHLHKHFAAKQRVKASADNADTGGGVQNQGKLADVILEHFLNIHTS